MANKLYTPFLESCLKGEIDLLTSNVKLVLVDTGAYTHDVAHQYLSDVPSGARIATSGNLANKSVTGAVFDADDVTISAVSGASIEAFIIYIDTGTASTSRLVLFADTVSSGLPVTPNGGSITVTFDSGSNKIFKIASA